MNTEMSVVNDFMAAASGSVVVMRELTIKMYVAADAWNETSALMKLSDKALSIYEMKYRNWSFTVIQQTL